MTRTHPPCGAAEMRPTAPLRGAGSVAAAIVAVLALLLTACGGAASEQDQAILALAEQNQTKLNLTEDLAQSELLDGATGEITNLSQVLTGDRPVLLWYWAPN